MQLTPRYLVKNRTTILANEAGFITEYKPVYQRHLQVYRGIDNVLEFKLLNADQKPVDISNYVPKFQAYDETGNLIIEHDGVAIVGDDSAANRGLFKVVITDNDLLNIKQQFLSYNIHLSNATSGEVTLTYTNTHFGAHGTIIVNAGAFPGPRDTYSVVQFHQSGIDPTTWLSDVVTAEPGINGNEALHTAAVYTTAYAGNVVVQATLDNQITNGTNWADVATLTFTGLETGPTPVNFNGVYSFLRFKTTANPADTVNKILVRN